LEASGVVEVEIVPVGLDEAGDLVVVVEYGVAIVATGVSVVVVVPGSVDSVVGSVVESLEVVVVRSL